MAAMSTKTEGKAPMTTTSTTRTELAERTGVLPSVVYLAIDVADRSSATAIGLLQDARAELRAGVDGGIELAENVAKALFRLARKATQRIDEVSAETLTAVERTLGGAAGSARETVRAATALTATAATGVAGERAAAAA
jgi:hypothetical protein